MMLLPPPTTRLPNPADRATPTEPIRRGVVVVGVDDSAGGFLAVEQAAAEASLREVFIVRSPQ